MGPRLYEGMSLREITDFLFLADGPEPADLILALGATRPERARKVTDLYQQGYATRILLTGGDNRGTGIPGAAEVRRQCLELGVPDAALALETQSLGTLENILMTVPMIDRLYGWDNIHTILLVTAPVHMRRARAVLARHIPPHVRILCAPDDRTDIQRDNWWQSDEGRQTVFRELEKVRRYAHQGEL